MSIQTEVDPAIRSLIHDEVAQQLERKLMDLGPRWSGADLDAAMDRIESRRKRVLKPTVTLEQIIEEHRKDFGRGPLVENDEADPGSRA